MPYSDIEQEREWKRNKYAANREQRRAHQKKFDEGHKAGKQAYNRRYGAAHAGSLAEYKRQWWAAHRETILEERRKNRYGMSPEQFSAMKAAQNGCCAVCKAEPKRWVVDHCHTTGVVRGLLCSNCNTALGLLHDSQMTLDNAKKYLKKYDTNTY